MNKAFAGLSFALILLVILGCDSPPWSRFIVVNNSNAEIRVRFYTKNPDFVSPCLYSAEDWEAKARSCSSTQKDNFVIAANQWIEAVVAPGSGVEMDRVRYPDVENNIEGNFRIDRLDIEGASGYLSLSGREEIFRKFEKEDTTVLSPSYGMSPKYVIYYR